MRREYILIKDYDRLELINYIICKIIDGLKNFIVNPQTTYVCCDTGTLNGLHLYFPDIIVDEFMYIAVREWMLQKVIEDKEYKTIDKNMWENIIDKNVAWMSPVRLPYCYFNDESYRINKKLSTYKISPNKLKQMALLSVRTNKEECNFEVVETYYGYPLYKEQLNFKQRTRGNVYIDESDEQQKLNYILKCAYKKTIVIKYGIMEIVCLIHIVKDSWDVV